MSKTMKERDPFSGAIDAGPPTGLPPPPTWQEAKAALADGDEGPMRHCLLWNGLPVEWLPVLRMAVGVETELQDVAKCYRSGDWEAAENQRENFARVSPTSADLESYSKTRVELDLRQMDAIGRRGAAEVARSQLAGLAQFFPEIFGDGTKVQGMLPPAVAEKIREVFGSIPGKTWRDFRRSATPAPRKRLRAVR